MTLIFSFIIISKGTEIVFRVGIAILEFHKEYLMSLDMEGMLKVSLFFVVN